jgi:hypothetical protein
MKRIFLIALVVMTISSVGLVQTGRNNALASGRELQKTQKKVVATDLVCSIQASWDQAGTGVIGGTNSTFPFIDQSGRVAINGQHELWIHFSVWNKGTVEAKNFKVEMIVRKDGQKIFGPPWTLTLAPDASQEYPPMRVADLHDGVQVLAESSVDISKVIAETNENNNRCQYRLAGHLEIQ